MEYLFEKEFDLVLSKSENDLKNISNSFNLSIVEAVMTDADYLIEASFEEFKKKVSEVVKTILDALIKFFKELYIQVNVKVEQIKLNKKLDELKNILANKRARAMHKKISYFDIKKYKKFYSDFINRYTSELKKGLNKEFKSIGEYEKWRTDMLNKLADFQFKLSDEEEWKLSVAINSAVSLTEEETKNRERNLKMVHDEGSMAIKGLDNYYKKIDTERSFVNYNKHSLHIFKLQNSFIGLICTKIAQCIKTVARIITKHTFACVTGLLVVLIAM